MTNRYEELTLVNFDQIKKEIDSGDTDNICNHLPAAGMNSNSIEEVITLIKLSVIHSDEWIRNAAFLALYHLHYRYRTELDPKILRELLMIGLKDKSNLVLSTVECIESDIKLFNPKLLDGV